MTQLPLAENTDKVTRYETHLQRSAEKNPRLLRSLQRISQMSLLIDLLQKSCEKNEIIVM